jgi:hypothetical protein
MKQKKKESFSESISGVRIFRDDIDYIISRCQNKSISIVISDENNIFENLDELVNLKGNSPSKFELQGKIESVNYSYLRILFEPRRVYVLTSGSEQLCSFGYELKDYLIDKIPWHYKVLNPLIWFAVTWIIIQFWVAIQPKDSKIITYQWLFWFGISALIIWLISLANRYLNFRINLSRKHDHGFIKRNSDNLILAIISAIVGAVLALLVSWLTNSPK